MAFSEHTSDTSTSDLLQDHFDVAGDTLDDLDFDIFAAADRTSAVHAKGTAQSWKLGVGLLQDAKPDPTPPVADAAKADAQAWDSAQQVLLRRVFQLEAQLAEQQTTAIAAERRACAAVAELQQAQAQEQTHAVDQAHQLQEAHEQALSALQARLDEAGAARAFLEHSLEEEREHTELLRQRAAVAESRCDAARELGRHTQELEGRVEALHSALEMQRQQSQERSDGMAAAEAAADAASRQLAAFSAERDCAVRRATEAEAAATSLQSQLTALQSRTTAEEHAASEASREQLAAVQELSQQRGEALRRIVDALAMQLHATGADAGAEADSALVEAEVVHSGPGSEVVDPQKAVAFVQAVSSCHLELERRWQAESAGMHATLDATAAQCDSLEADLQEERERGRCLAADLAEMQTQQRAAHQALDAAQERLRQLHAAETARTAAEGALEACQRELSAALAKAAGAALDAARWRGEAEACQEVAAAADLRVAAAEAQAAELNGSAEARDERAAEMRQAAAAAMDFAESLRGTLQDECRQAAVALRQVSAGLDPAECGAADGPDDPHAAALLQALQRGADALESTSHAADVAAFSAGMDAALCSVVEGYTSLADMLHERQHMHTLLSSMGAILGAGRDPSPAVPPALLSAADPVAEEAAGQALPLLALVKVLTSHVAEVAEGLQAEKCGAEQDAERLRADARQLAAQVDSLHSVLRSLEDCVAPDHARALIDLADARRHAAELDQERRSLARGLKQAQRAAQDAQAAAAPYWAGVRGDMAQLVAHAERAQVEAEAAVQRQRRESAKALDAARAREHAAAAARSAAEAQAAQLQEQVAALQRQLDAARQEAAAAVRRATEAEAACEVQRAADTVQQQQFSAADAAGEAAAERDVARLQGCVTALQAELTDVQEQAAAAASNLAAAIRRAEQAEALAARHAAAAEAAAQRVGAVAAEAATGQERAQELELRCLQLQTRLEAAEHAISETAPPLAAASCSGAHASPPPSTRDASLLHQHLAAAQRQVQALKALNANLEEQLAAAGTACAAREELQVAHAMIDALQAQLSGSSAVSGVERTAAPNDGAVRSAGKGRSSALGGVGTSSALDRITAMWRQACAVRDCKLQGAEARVQELLAQLEASQAAARVAESEVCTLHEQRCQHDGSIAELEGRLRAAEMQGRSTVRQLAAAEAAAAEAVLARQRQASAEQQCALAAERAAAAERRCEALHSEVAAQRAAAAKAVARLPEIEAAAARARAADERCSEAERALAAHLEATAAAGMAQQLASAWAAERELALQVADVRGALAGARGEAVGLGRELQAARARCRLLQAQLHEALGTLGDQSLAMEALQQALQQQRSTAAGGGGGIGGFDPPTDEERALDDALLQRYEAGAVALERCIRAMQRAVGRSPRAGSGSPAPPGSPAEVDALLSAVLRLLHSRECDVVKEQSAQGAALSAGRDVFE